MFLKQGFVNCCQGFERLCKCEMVLANCYQGFEGFASVKCMNSHNLVSFARMALLLSQLSFTIFQ